MKKVFRFLKSVVIIPAILGYLAIGFFFRAGMFHRKQMDGLVNEIRRRQIPSEARVQFYVADLSRPQLIQIDPDSERARLTNVWATRTEDGLLSVSIMTNDKGHYGEFGFTYSDAPQSPTKSGEGEASLRVPGRMNYPVKKIDAHWWEVANRDR